MGQMPPATPPDVARRRWFSSPDRGKGALASDAQLSRRRQPAPHGHVHPLAAVGASSPSPRWAGFFGSRSERWPCRDGLHGKIMEGERRPI